MILNIDNKPIAIICAQRTGSTALSDCLARQYNLTNFEEAFHPDCPQSAVDLSNTSRFLFNIKHDQINDSNFQQIINLYNQSFRIRLRRRDVVKQIVSYYLLCSTKIPHYRNPPSQETHNEVHIDMKLLSYCVRAIKNCNQGLDDWSHSVDADLFYEDLTFNNTVLHVYPKPSNYSVLIELVTKML